MDRKTPYQCSLWNIPKGRLYKSYCSGPRPWSGQIDEFSIYPILRPGRPEELGVKHLFQISKPMLFISGTRDPNARPEQLKDLISELGPGARLHLIDDGDRFLNARKGRAIYFKTLDRSATVLEDWIRTQVNLVSS